MAARLADLAAHADPAQDPYLSAQRAVLDRERLDDPTLSPGDRMETRVMLGRELLVSGDPRAAVEVFEPVLADMRAAGPAFSKGMVTSIEELIGVCWLRLGEQDNCVLHHGTESCLMPIRGDGVHTVTEGSRKAFETFSGILERHPNDLVARWLLNIAAMTLGEYPGGVPDEWLVPPSAWDSDDDIGRFPDVARERGVDVLGLCGGVCMEDFDLDGDLDLLVSSWDLRDQVRYLVNRGDGRFDDRTEESGLLGITGGLNMLHADYDSDGLPDVLLLRGAWRKEAGAVPNSLLRNLGGGRFADVTEAAGMLSFHPTQTAAFVDYDGDGWLDVFVGNESVPLESASKHPCELYHNDGDGTFTECAARSGVDVLGYVKGVAADDYDGDGRPDLYLSRQDGPNLLLHNLGPADGRARDAAPSDATSRAPAAPVRDWRFVDVASQAGVTEPAWSFPTWFFDYDADGRPDLFASGYQWLSVRRVAREALGGKPGGELPHLYRNRGDGTFEDVTERVGLDTLLLGMGSNFGDLDDDGWLDLYVGTGEPDFMALYPNRAFRNDAGRRFLDVTTSGGFGHLQKGHAIAFGDIDGDGDQDVYAVMGGAYSGDRFQNALFLNPGHAGHRIVLRLEGTVGNRSAIGARVRVTLERADGSPRDVYVTVGTGGSFGSSSLQQEIGLGDARRIVAVEVRWPAPGLTERFDGVAPDAVYRVVEGSGRIEPLAELPPPAGDPVTR
ncbi:MAG: CRTAC1 family protein [Planctomycetes bacterium]|nr:CRTAC1 family protein [Planctomycetota bacterium]